MQDQLQSVLQHIDAHRRSLQRHHAGYSGARMHCAACICNDLACKQARPGARWHRARAAARRATLGSWSQAGQRLGAGASHLPRAAPWTWACCRRKCVPRTASSRICAPRSSSSLVSGTRALLSSYARADLASRVPRVVRLAQSICSSYQAYAGHASAYLKVLWIWGLLNAVTQL